MADVAFAPRGKTARINADQIIKMRKEGASFNQIAKTLHNSTGTICRIIDEAGLSGIKAKKGGGPTIYGPRRMAGEPSLRESIIMKDEEIAKIGEWVSKVRAGTYTLSDVSIGKCLYYVSTALAYAKECRNAMPTEKT